MMLKLLKFLRVVNSKGVQFRIFEIKLIKFVDEVDID